MRVLPFRAVIAVALGACAPSLDAGDEPTVEPAAATLNLTQFVNPFIGTDDSNSPNPVPGGAGGSTYPGPVLPFGMVQLSPDTDVRDFNVQMSRAKPGQGAGLHSHKTIETFMPLNGTWSIFWGDGTSSSGSHTTRRAVSLPTLSVTLSVNTPWPARCLIGYSASGVRFP